MDIDNKIKKIKYNKKSKNTIFECINNTNEINYADGKIGVRDNNN